MTAPLWCGRCGHEGDGVRMKLVDLEAEARRDRTRIPMVEVVQEIAHRHVVEKVRHTVPQRYGHEPRCRDSQACDARVMGAEVEL